MWAVNPDGEGTLIKVSRLGSNNKVTKVSQSLKSPKVVTGLLELKDFAF